jgi:hypothetical protein
MKNSDLKKIWRFIVVAVVWAFFIYDSQQHTPPIEGSQVRQSAPAADAFQPENAGTYAKRPTKTPTPTSIPTLTPTSTPLVTPVPTSTPTAGPTATPPPPPSGIYFPPPGQTLDMQNLKNLLEVGLADQLIPALSARTNHWAVWRHGYLVHVQGNFNLNKWTKSLRKTFHAATVGAALQQGKIPSLDQPISFWQTNLTGNDALATWSHVLTQSAGFDYPGCGDTNDYLPGVMWTYSDLNPVNLNHALAKAYGRANFYDNYQVVLGAAFTNAIGMQGWEIDPMSDGIHLKLDLEDMGRLGLLMIAGGDWNGNQLLPPWFVEEMSAKQTDNMLVNYNGCNDGQINLNPQTFPEAPYGFMTWTNDGTNYYPGADDGWAWGWGAGGFYLLWNRDNGIVFAGTGVRSSDTLPTANGIPQLIEANILGDNPLVP